MTIRKRLTRSNLVMLLVPALLLLGGGLAVWLLDALVSGVQRIRDGADCRFGQRPGR